MVRIFEISTETPDNKRWGTHNVAAQTAKEAIKFAQKKFSTRIGERLLQVRLLASETENE